jgi:hypothetical protein
MLTTFTIAASVGLASGKWRSYAILGNQPRNQGSDEGVSVTFQTAPLEAEFEILGHATLDITFTCDKLRRGRAIGSPDRAWPDEPPRDSDGATRR